MNEIPDAGALLVAIVEYSGTDAPAFHRWYNDVHIPQRLACTGFLSARRFAVDGKPNQAGCIYRLTSPKALLGDTYLALAAAPDEETVRIRTVMRTVSREVFTPIGAEIDAGPA